mgnify:CR=1 FL=1|jgi:hypothetical protein
MIPSREIAPVRLFLHSLGRDWKSWSRAERISAVGLLLGAPLVSALSIGLTLGLTFPG